MNWKYFSTMIALVLPAIAGAQNSYFGSDCTGNFQCGTEVVVGSDNRVKPSIIQPVSSVPIMGSCGMEVPSSQSYMAILNGVTCGEGADAKDRLPIQASEKVMDRWDLLSRSGKATAREEMQRIRQAEMKWSDSIEFPMYESWTFQKKVGDFHALKCGVEPWPTVCQRERIEYYQDTERYCAEYAPELEESNSGGSGYSYDNDSSPSSSSRTYSKPVESPFKSTPSTKPKGSGESKRELQNKFQQRAQSRKSSSYQLNQPFRGLASGECVRWATRTVTRQRPAPPLTYNCMKTRPRYCEWFTTETVQRRCKNHEVTYALEYVKDPQWNPNYRAADPTRDYIDILPNKFDLLPGESEEVIVYSNLGRSSMLKPAVVFNNKWNDYVARANPEVVKCEYNMKPQIKIEVSTLGRIKRKSPNPLAIPRDSEGNILEPLKFETAINNQGQVANGVPYAVALQDYSRATLLAAAKHSRTFTRPEGAGQKPADAIHKKKALKQQEGTVTTNGYWAETRFKVQLFRQDRWNRDVRVTQPLKFSSNQADIFEDSVKISLKGEDGLARFYRPSGPLEPILGGIYKAFGVQLTPGEEYIMKVQVTQRGLPFYENGCKDGSSNCEGEDATDESWSVPLLLKWTADKNVDQRTWLKKLRDWQEHFMLF